LTLILLLLLTLLRPGRHTTSFASSLLLGRLLRLRCRGLAQEVCA
jgi:hypothetical protein